MIPTKTLGIRNTKLDGVVPFAARHVIANTPFQCVCAWSFVCRSYLPSFPEFCGLSKLGWNLCLQFCQKRTAIVRIRKEVVEIGNRPAVVHKRADFGIFEAFVVKSSVDANSKVAIFY